jgi:hypothetical protein
MQDKRGLKKKKRTVGVVTYMGLEELDAYIHAFDHIEKVCLEDE